MSFKQSHECEFLHVLSSDFPEIKIPVPVLKEYKLSTSDINEGDDTYMFFLDKMLERTSNCLDGKTVFLILENTPEPDKGVFLQILCPAFCTKKELEIIFECVNESLNKICDEVKQKEQIKKVPRVHH